MSGYVDTSYEVDQSPTKVDESGYYEYESAPTDPVYTKLKQKKCYKNRELLL
jgi:hypothetical protein